MFVMDVTKMRAPTIRGYYYTCIINHLLLGAVDDGTLKDKMCHPPYEWYHHLRVTIKICHPPYEWYHHLRVTIKIISHWFITVPTFYFIHCL